VPASIIAGLREKFTNTLILSGGYDVDRAEADLQSGRADLVAFGRGFIANPDLPERLEQGTELAQADQATFYAPGPEGFHQGYTDYPVLAETEAVR
jgi:N-ethylmaleimide reductase